MTLVAEDDMDVIVRYLLNTLKNKQAARKFVNDVEKAIQVLESSAESFPLCTNPKLKKLGYRKFNFEKSKYFALYRVVEDMVYIDDIFHQLQDYENKIQ